MVDQGLFHVQSQQLRQEQIIAPHQIQSLEILQMPLQDLYARIQEELAGNPVMELGPEVKEPQPGDSPQDAVTNEQDAQPTAPAETEFGEQLIGDRLAELSGPGSNSDDAAGIAAEKDEFLAGLMQIEEGWRDYAPPSQGSRSSDDEEKRRFFFDSLTTETTLEEELQAQLRTSDADKELLRLGELVIGSIDPTGYIKTPIEELSRASGSTEARMNEALKLIQSFEPAGIGARDLRECLLLQLERSGQKDSLEWRIVDRHLTQVARNRLPALARTLRTTLTEVAHSVETIRKLQPRPGSGIGGGAAHFVQPDVIIVFNENGELEASAHERSLPRVRISKMYRQLLESRDTPSETRKYIRDKVLGVKTLQRSLMQRESTIKLIADSIVQHQQDFFSHGDDRMVPLTMTQVAEEIGVHETTVSRAIAHKYADTPRGLLPLRHFFSSGYVTEDGEELSSLAVKSKLQAIVDHEDPQKPLSDQKLVDMLRAEGFDVARRTVAKYRDELQIPSSHLRRQHGI